MTLQLQRFINGDTNYITKHNSNLDLIEAAIAALELLAGNSTAASSANVAKAFQALFGVSASLIGAYSYKCTGSGNILTVQPGFCWRPSLNAVVSKTTPTTISFSGVSASTWYITIDSSGTPIRTNSIAEAAYSVVWTGSAFGTITKLLNVVWGAADDVAAQSSTVLGTSFTSLDSRLEASENKAVAGDLARTYLLGRLSKSVAGNSNVTLTADEANNLELVFTGAVSGEINISVPLSNAPRSWLVINNTTGGYKLTLKGLSGTGVALPPNVAIWVYHDGTNILTLPKAAVLALPFNTSITADFSQAHTIKVTLGGNATITLTGAEDRQKCMLELTQDSVGGRTITLVNHRFGSDLTNITLSTGPGLTDKIGFIYDAAAAKFDVVALMRGF
ncbi:hypothetical protein [Nitrosomonas communis]|uniref:Tail fiber protein n=1 Tax=Nitrosomonas communis TaxID=44574 RepID=A0A1I4NBB6_9PROT|nr:hypothetical protein [Nitrosomonas communis]SFM12824.1 hypothetical protein SAMN05421863_101426 [Nitrosomonas communis]